jgi:hypothetical protein
MTTVRALASTLAILLASAAGAVLSGAIWGWEKVRR